MSQQQTDALIVRVVMAIPAGQVASYGQIARLAGQGRGARRVAAALRRADVESDPPLPWHRVLRSDGRLGLPAGSPGWHEQIQRLRREAVAVIDGRVDLRKYQWNGAETEQTDRDELDSLLWRLQE